MGDCNSKSFYSLINANRRKSAFFSIEDEEGTVLNKPADVEYATVSHFQGILAPKNISSSRPLELNHVSPSGRLNDLEVNFISRNIDDEENVQAIKCASPHKSPGPYGFNAHFYKVCSPIIGKDISSAIRDFFKHGKLLNQVNTFIVLIPKTDNPSKPSDFHPISLANEIYKIISRMIAVRLKPLMKKNY